MHIILKSDRYPGLGEKFPPRITCEGTLEQAKALAEYMSNWYPGCEYIFYVDGGLEG